MDFKKVIANIDSYNAAIKFCNIIMQIHIYCNNMKENEYFWMESNRDCFGKIEDTTYYSTGTNELVYTLNHSPSSHNTTCISTDFAFVSFSPDLGIDISTGYIANEDIPVIDSEDSWFQYSTLYSKEDMVAFVFHKQMIAGYWESMYLDTNYLSRFGYAMGVDLYVLL